MAGRGKYKTVDYYQKKANGIIDGFEAFSDEGTYYFTCNKGGKVFIISEGYTSSSARNRGMQTVAKNLMLATQFYFENPSNNQYYFTLKAGNNQEIAKSKIFATEDAMHAFIGWLIGKRFSVNLINEEDIDDHLSILKNGNEAVLSGIYSKQIDYFIFKGSNGKQYFSFKNKTGKTLLLNTNVRGYDDITRANKILAEVLQFAPNLNNYDFKLTKNGKYYFYLKNSESANIAKSTFFATEDEMLEVIELLTLANNAVSESTNDNGASKSVNLKSELLQEIDTNGKTTETKASATSNIISNTPQKPIEKTIDQPVETKPPFDESDDLSDEEEFTLLLKQQQKAELEVRLKKEKEEQDRKDKQNQFAQANAAVLRKHKEGQTIELDDKLKQEDIIKGNNITDNSVRKIIKTESPNQKTTKENEDGKTAKNTYRNRPRKSSENKPENVAKNTPRNTPRITAEGKSDTIKNKVSADKASQTNQPKTVELPKTVAEKPTELAQPSTTAKPALSEKKVSAKSPVSPKLQVEKTKQAADKENQRSVYEKEYDPEIEKAKIATQARFDELKKAAEFRKQNDKVAEPTEKKVEKKGVPREDQKYDWWSKKEKPASDALLLDDEVEDNRETIDLSKLLKPALIALLAVSLLIVGYYSLKSGDKDKSITADNAPFQESSAENTTLANKKYYNTALPENFSNLKKGSIEWHIINCIANESCPQKQNFQWVETNYQFNETYLSANALQSLDNIAQIMIEYTTTRLEIYGHIAANEKDNVTSGQSLSEQRAKQIKDFLVEREVSPDRLSYKGLSKTRPIQAGNSLTAHHYNKRIELLLFK